MTTLDDAIKWFEQTYGDTEQWEAVARVLRSVASASADAEKGFEAWRTQMLAEPVRKTVQYTDKDVFLAGHAAATAVMQAEVDWLKERICSCGQSHYCQSEVDEIESRLDVMCDEVVRMDGLLLNFHSNPTLYAHEARKAHAEIDNNRPALVTEILARRKEQINAVE